MKLDENGNIVPLSDELTAISHAIRNRRRLLKLNQDDLAELAGISQRYLYSIETGQANPSLETLIKIIDVLGLRIEIKLKSAK